MAQSYGIYNIFIQISFKCLFLLCRMGLLGSYHLTLTKGDMEMNPIQISAFSEFDKCILCGGRGVKGTVEHINSHDGYIKI